MTVSITMPAAIATATSRNCCSGMIASSAKLAASVMPATVMARDACEPATAIASRSGRCLASSQIRPTTNTL